jgi:hypothetical protein
VAQGERLLPNGDKMVSIELLKNLKKLNMEFLF